MANGESKSRRYALSGAAAAVAASRDFAERHGLARDDSVRLCIVLEELVTNIFEHGGVPVGEDAELLLEAEVDGIRILLTDGGAPFDPRTAPPEPVHKERGGGAGIQIVRNWADIVDYRRVDGRNQLELKLRLRGAPEAG